MNETSRAPFNCAGGQGAIKTLQDSWREQQLARGEQVRAYLAAWTREWFWGRSIEKMERHNETWRIPCPWKNTRQLPGRCGWNLKQFQLCPDWGAWVFVQCKAEACNHHCGGWKSKHLDRWYKAITVHQPFLLNIIGVARRRNKQLIEFICNSVKPDTRSPSR